jgi:hypothetical protein
MPVQEQENPAVMAERTRQWEANQIDAEIRTVKDLRQSIDLQIQRVKALSPSRERALVITKLREGVMWLGMDLKRINEANPGASPNPYPNSKDPSNTKIEPTADGLEL